MCSQRDGPDNGPRMNDDLDGHPRAPHRPHQRAAQAHARRGGEDPVHPRDLRGRRIPVRRRGPPGRRHRGPPRLRPRRRGPDRGASSTRPARSSRTAGCCASTGTTAPGAASTPTEQQSIAELPDVKVRLGNLNANNQQKGVDSLIRSDLESLARHRAISDAALLGGDEDLVSAVEAAQGYGARVHLWGIEAPEGRNQAEPLLWEVDSQRTFDLDVLQAVRRPGAPSRRRTRRRARPAPRARTSGSSARRSPRSGWPRGAASHWSELLPGHPYLPGSVDQDLLVEAEALLQYSLRGQADLRRALRDGFWEHLRRSTSVPRCSAAHDHRRGRSVPERRPGRAAVSWGRSAFGECSAPAMTVRRAPRRTAMASRSCTGQVSSRSPDSTCLGSADGGQLGDPVRLRAQLAAGRDELGRAVVPASGGAGRPASAASARRASVSSGRVERLDRLPHLGHVQHGERVPQQLHPLLLGGGDLRPGPRT